MNAKSTSPSLFALDGHMAAKCHDDVFDNGQSQTGATLLPAAGFVHTVKPLKKSGKMHFGNTDTAVLNAYGQCPGSLFRFDENFRPPFSVFRWVG